MLATTRIIILHPKVIFTIRTYMVWYNYYRLNTPPPRGAVGGVTFHSGNLSFPHLTPAMPMVRWRFVRWRFLACLLPCISACVPLSFSYRQRFALP